MSKFKPDDKIIISLECEDEEYAGLTGTVIDVVPHADGLVNRVCLDKPVHGSSILWFADSDLIDTKSL